MSRARGRQQPGHFQRVGGSFRPRRSRRSRDDSFSMEGFISSLKNLFVRFSPPIPHKEAWKLVNSEGRLYDYYISRKARVKDIILFGFFRVRDMVAAKRIFRKLHGSSRSGCKVMVDWAREKGSSRFLDDLQSRRHDFKSTTGRCSRSYTAQPEPLAGAAVEVKGGRVEGRSPAKVRVGGVPTSGKKLSDISFGSLTIDGMAMGGFIPSATSNGGGREVDMKGDGRLAEVDRKLKGVMVDVDYSNEDDGESSRMPHDHFTEVVGEKNGVWFCLDNDGAGCSYRTPPE